MSKVKWYENPVVITISIMLGAIVLFGFIIPGAVILSEKFQAWLTAL